MGNEKERSQSREESRRRKESNGRKGRVEEAMVGNDKMRRNGVVEKGLKAYIGSEEGEDVVVVINCNSCIRSIGLVFSELTNA